MTETNPSAAVTTRAGTRISPVRLGVVVLAAVLTVGGLVAVARPIVSPPPPPDPTGFAAYVDVTATPSYPFETPDSQADQNVILSFIVASPTDACSPSWGGYYGLDQAASALELDRRIAQLRSVGGSASVSFGGQANTELATECTDQGALTDAYRQVIDRYELTSIDLDIEGSDLADSAGATRRARSMAALQSEAREAGRTLDIWLTLPVSTSGLTPEGQAQLTAMLAAGVDLTGVNGMTMDFGTADVSGHMGQAVEDATLALQAQAFAAFKDAGRKLSTVDSWNRVGITPMIGQNDVPGEVFTIEDAQQVNRFAREHGVGRISMWSANRDSTCQRPLPTVTTVVQDNCSGIDQAGMSFASVLADDTVPAIPAAPAPPTTTPQPVAGNDGPEIVDDPATSPYPIWDALGTYPAGTKVVWKHNVYQAKWWNSGADPTTPYASEYDNPWLLLGPVMPGDTPAPLPTIPAGTYPDWNPAKAYVAGQRVQLDGVAYEAKWWSQDQRPGQPVAGGSPWVLVYPGQ